MNRMPQRRSKESPVYEAVTRGVMVRVVTNYLPAQSCPEDSRFVWAYMVEIENHSEETVQLVSRKWIITDGLNRTEEVAGPGVVGEQPRLKPRDAFRYTSGCPLSTPSGEMRGTYQMVTDGGDVFEAVIPAFSLHLPGAHRAVN
jgi:ApaG protein